MFKLFGMLENFFYISLGITFALILLLVYHFKQRLSTAEKKSDTMYEILTNVVQELNLIKSQTHHLYQLQHQAQSNVSVEAQAQPQIMVVNEKSETESKSESEGESESESESESEDDDEYLEEEYEDEDEFVTQADDDVSVIRYELIEVADPDTGNNLSSNVDIGEELNLDVAENVELVINAVSNDVNISLNEEIVPETEKSVDIKRMNLTQLKSLAATKLPDLDVSKMKKAELIKILTNARPTEEGWSLTE